MIGRDRELVRLEELIVAARDGRSGALIVSGEAGIGKTALLGRARELADGATVLTASGSEAESRLTFAGLADLLGPIVSGIDDLPEHQADALRGALALGPPQPGDRFTAYVATLGLLAAAAESAPVLCILDDAHWLDAESLEAVQFVARRLEAEGVAVLLGVRDGVDAVLDASRLPRLRLSGLTAADARRLVSGRSPVEPAPAVLDAVVAGAGGNPLALTELADALTASQLAGREPLPDPLPVGPYLEQALLRPLDGLPASTRRALVIASVDDGAAEFLIRALAAEGLSMTDLEPAERAGVIDVGGTRALFSHPLVRAAVYHAAGAPERRAAHGAYAMATEAMEEPGALDRRAWHLALASAGPDETAAAELEQAAAHAAARNAHAAAAEAFEAAGRLSPDVIERGRRLSAAGNSAFAAGDFPRSAALLDEVVALDAAPGQALQALATRGHVEAFGGSARRAIEMLAGAADQVGETSPAAAAALLARAVITCQMRADVHQAMTLAERATALAETVPDGLAAVVDVALTSANLFRGEPTHLSVDTQRAVVRQAASGDPVASFWAVAGLHDWILEERYVDAALGLTEIIGAARTQSTPSVLPLALTLHADLLVRTDRQQEARAVAFEAIHIAEETGQNGVRGYAYGILTRIEALLGRVDDCRQHAAAALEGVETSEADSLPIFAGAGLGLLALGLGDLEEALQHLSAAHRRYVRGGTAHPLLVPCAQDLIETQIRLGRTEEASGLLDELSAVSDRLEVTWPQAAVERCRGLMADDDLFENHFAAALNLHARTPTPFERARTELCLGERRRRARRVREARTPLESALVAFESMGAEPWAESARRELRAAGGRPREARRIATAELTPQELQVALAVGEGASNKQAATALLISPKTVEYHLAKVYEKLGVRSRAELAGRMAREGVSPSGTEPPD